MHVNVGTHASARMSATGSLGAALDFGSQRERRFGEHTQCGRRTCAISAPDRLTRSTHRVVKVDTCRRSPRHAPALGEKRVEIRTLNADATRADANRWYLAPVDHVPHRLWVEPERLRDFGDGQQFIWHVLSLIDGNDGQWATIDRRVVQCREAVRSVDGVVLSGMGRPAGLRG